MSPDTLDAPASRGKVILIPASAGAPRWPPEDAMRYTTKQGSMAKTAINLLFPSSEIPRLPTWRFVLHFMAPKDYRPEMLANAKTSLKATQWSIITFPQGIDSIALHSSGEAVSVPIEVPEDRRRRPNSLSVYESDVWKIMADMAASGFGDLYYEAVDWKQ